MSGRLFKTYLAVILSCILVSLYPAPLSSQMPQDQSTREIGIPDMPPILRGRVERIEKSNFILLSYEGKRMEMSLLPETLIVKIIPVEIDKIRVGDRLLIHGSMTGPDRVYARTIHILDKNDETIKSTRRPDVNHVDGEILGKPAQGPVTGTVVTTKPLKIRINTGETVLVETAHGTEVLKETSTTPSEIEKGAEIVVIAPPLPGMEKRRALKVVLFNKEETYAINELRPEHVDPLAKDVDVIDGKALVTINYNSEIGRISSYISGTTLATFYDNNSFKLLKDGGFKLVEVFIWLSRPKMPSEQKPFTLDKAVEVPLAQNIEIAKKQIRSILEIGAEPLIFMVTSLRPSDMNEYREKVKSIISELRNTAKEVGKDLLLFRFGNEPDFKDIFWQGSRKDFFETYKVWAGAVKSISPRFLLEAPGFAFATSRDFNNINDFTLEFLNYCKNNKVPLDVFSFHYYGTSIYNLSRAAKVVKKVLSEYSTLSPVFGIPRLGIDEWNIFPFMIARDHKIKIFDTVYTAAHNVGALIEMSKNDVWLAIRMGGVDIPEHDPDAPFRKGVNDGVIEEKIKILTPPAVGSDLMVTSNRTPKPVYYGFSAFNKIYSAPLLLEIANKERNSFIIAGKSMKGDEINIIASYYNERLVNAVEKSPASHQNKAENIQTEIVIKNFPWHKVKDRVKVMRYIVDDNNNLYILESREILGSSNKDDISIKFKANLPSVSFIQVKMH